MDRSVSNNPSQGGKTSRPLTVVRVKGTIHAELADWLEPIEVRFLDCGDTQLVYANLDQAGLYGLLVRLRDLGLTLVSVENKDT